MGWIRGGWELFKGFGPSIGRMMGGTVGTALKVGAVGAAAATAWDGITNGFRGIGNFFRGASNVTNPAAEVSSDTAVASTEFNLWNFIAMIGRALKVMGIGGGFPEMLMSAGQRGVAQARDPNGTARASGVATPGSEEGTNYGTTALAATLGGAGLGAGYSLLRGRGGPSNPGGGNTPGGAPGGAAGRAAAEVGEEAAEAGIRAAGNASRFSRFMSRLPGIGKFFAVAGTATAVGAMAFGAGDAEAATPTSLTPGAVRSGTTVETAAGVGSVQALSADVAGMGLSIVGGRVAAQTIATAAAPVAARLGLQGVARAIPGVSSIYAAGETLFNVGGDLLRGDFKRAGLNLVSGVGETVAGLGGGLTYFTLGTAWRESVRGVGAAAFGEENTINHSLVVQAGSFLRDSFFGPSRGTTTPEVAPTPTRQPALSFGF